MSFTKPLVKGAVVTALDISIVQMGRMDQQALMASGLLGVASTIAFATSHFLIQNKYIPTANILPFVNDEIVEERILDAGMGALTITAINEMGGLSIPRALGDFYAPLFIKRDVLKSTGVFMAGDIIGEYIFQML